MLKTTVRETLDACEYACRPRHLASTDERRKMRPCRTLFEFQKLLGNEKQAAFNWQ